MDPDEIILIACNFTPVPRHNYRIGVPRGGYWEEILNSDAPLYGGSGQGNIGGVRTAPVAGTATSNRSTSSCLPGDDRPEMVGEETRSQRRPPQVRKP